MAIISAVAFLFLGDPSSGVMCVARAEAKPTKRAGTATKRKITKKRRSRVAPRRGPARKKTSTARARLPGAKRAKKRATKRPTKRPTKHATKRATKRADVRRKKAQVTASKAAAAAVKRKKKRFTQRLKRCRSRSQRNTRQCRALLASYRKFLAEQKAKAAKAKAARAQAQLAARCRSRRHRKSKKCRTYLAQQRRKSMHARICGRRYGRARRKETVARFARRYGVSEGTVRRLNKMSGSRLRRGRRYLVYRSPWEGQRLANGVLLRKKPGIIGLQRPERGWGKPIAVAAIERGAGFVQESSPLATHLIVGDLSKSGGGCLPPHRSHRGGLDADVGYYLQGGQQHGWLTLARPETIDADRTWQLLAAFLATGRLQYAFIDYDLQRPLYEAGLRAGETEATLKRVFQFPRPKSAAKVAIVRHLRGHADHMHVRFTCPPNSRCTLQAAAEDRLAGLRQARHGGGRSHALAQFGKRPRSSRRAVRKTSIVPNGW